MKISANEQLKINEEITLLLKGNDSTNDCEFKKIISRAVSKILNSSSYGLREKQNLIEYLFCKIRGFDILTPLMNNHLVTEIMVNGPQTIFYEENGNLKNFDKKFESKEDLNNLIFRIFESQNKNISESRPLSDVRLKCGSRANAVLYPIAPDGPCLTIRKFTGILPNMSSLIECEFLDEEKANFLINCVKEKKNIFISGGTGTGKTTFLNVLSGFIPEEERIVTIEDSSELKLQNSPNLVRLEARNSLHDSNLLIEISDLIRCALRMRPDRIIVGEVRGKEASDMLWAMNTGHMGSMSTGHANSADDMLSRLCIMVQQSSSLPVDVINKTIAKALDVIIHLKRLESGGRRLESIIEVKDYKKGEFDLEKIF